MDHRYNKLSFASAVVSALVLGSLATLGMAQERERSPRELPIKPAVTELQEFHMRDYVFVKFLDDSGVTLSSNAFRSEDAFEQRQIDDYVNPLLGQGISARPMLDEEPLALQEHREDAQNALGVVLPDLSKWYLLKLDTSVDAADVINQLNRSPLVEIALPVPEEAPPPDCSVSQCEGQQGYLFSPSDPSSGVNAELVWDNFSANGQGVEVTNIERGYYAHNDFPTITNLLGHASISHGTHTFGVIGAKRNSFGASGITHGSTFNFSKNTHPNLCSSLSAAVNAMSAGDVVIVEVQTAGSGPTNYVPVEWYKPWYDCIKQTVALGYNVVIAAGNGNQNLDSYYYSSGVYSAGHKPFLALNDSGSIIVGAGNPADQSRLSFSTYGSRVNLQGWGSSVFTTSTSNGYTSSFDGTSSATAVVGGSVALTQSAYKAYSGVKATPWQIRQALISTGTAQGSPTSTHIGPLPNVAAAAQYLAPGAGGDVPPNFSVDSYMCYGQGEADWDAVSGATSYQLQASHSPSFSSPWYQYIGSNTNKILNVSQTTYFRVRACTSGDCGGYTSMDSLTPISGCY